MAIHSWTDLNYAWKGAERVQRVFKTCENQALSWPFLSDQKSFILCSIHCSMKSQRPLNKPRATCSSAQVAQLNQSYRDIFEDMQGFARLKLKRSGSR